MSNDSNIKWPEGDSGVKPFDPLVPDAVADAIYSVGSRVTVVEEELIQRESLLVETRCQKLVKIQEELAKLLISPSPDPEDEGTAGNSEIKAAMTSVSEAITEILIQENTHRY